MEYVAKNMAPVSTQKYQALQQRMAALGIFDADLEEQFVRAGGSGGQNVNKVATCVMLRHRPSGLAVKCQAARTQGENRFLARRRLCDALEEKTLGAASRAQQAREKIRRQKRRRSRRAKEKMLADKSHHAEKKRQRRVGREE